MHRFSKRTHVYENSTFLSVQSHAWIGDHSQICANKNLQGSLDWKKVILFVCVTNILQHMHTILISINQSQFVIYIMQMYLAK
jgi:hypothetical protein